MSLNAKDFALAKTSEIMQLCTDLFYMPSKKLGVAIVNWNRHTKGRKEFISDLDIDLMKDKIYKNL